MLKDLNDYCCVLDLCLAKALLRVLCQATRFRGEIEAIANFYVVFWYQLDNFINYMALTTLV